MHSEDRAVCKTVLNIGERPSIEDGEQRTVELHILHKFASDFYGHQVKVVMAGFIRCVDTCLCRFAKMSRCYMAISHHVCDWHISDCRPKSRISPIRLESYPTEAGQTCTYVAMHIVLSGTHAPHACCATCILHDVSPCLPPSVELSPGLSIGKARSVSVLDFGWTQVGQI